MDVPRIMPDQEPSAAVFDIAAVFLKAERAIRANNTFGFEEYRRDVEDGRGWFLVGHYAQHVYDSTDAALAAAHSKVIWLGDVLSTE